MRVNLYGPEIKSVTFYSCNTIVLCYFTVGNGGLLYCFHPQTTSRRVISIDFFLLTTIIQNLNKTKYRNDAGHTE